MGLTAESDRFPPFLRAGRGPSGALPLQVSAGTVGSRPARLVARLGPAVPGRVRAIRKEASRKGRQVKPITRQSARHSIVFTAFPAEEFPAAAVLEWYRLRRQVEPVFQRFKSLAQLGYLPRHNDDSAKAWLYGKLRAALPVERLMHHALAISPWGHDLEAPPAAQRVACLPIRSEPSQVGHRTRQPAGPGAQRMARNLTVAGRTTSSTAESGVLPLQARTPNQLAPMGECAARPQREGGGSDGSGLIKSRPPPYPPEAANVVPRLRFASSEPLLTSHMPFRSVEDESASMA